MSIPTCARVSGDVCVKFFSEDKKHIFHFWFNTNMIQDNALTLKKSELDKAVKDTEHKRFDEDFSVSVDFREDDIIRPQSNEAREVSVVNDEEVMPPKVETESRRKLDVMSTQMKKTLKAYSKLYSRLSGGHSPRPTDSLQKCLQDNNIDIREISWDSEASAKSSDHDVEDVRTYSEIREESSNSDRFVDISEPDGDSCASNTNQPQNGLSELQPIEHKLSSLRVSSRKSEGLQREAEIVSDISTPSCRQTSTSVTPRVSAGAIALESEEKIDELSNASSKAQPCFLSIKDRIRSLQQSTGTVVEQNRAY